MELRPKDLGEARVDPVDGKARPLTSPHAQVVQLLRDAGCCEDDAARDMLARAILDVAFEEAAKVADNAARISKALGDLSTSAQFNITVEEAHRMIQNLEEGIAADIRALKSPTWHVPTTAERENDDNRTKG